MSERAAAIHFGVSRASVKKIMGFSVPPLPGSACLHARDGGYRRTAEIKRPKLAGYIGFIDQWMLEDLSRNRTQRHTAKRIFKRLRDEHGFKGGYSTVKNYVREHGRCQRQSKSEPKGSAKCYHFWVGMIGGWPCASIRAAALLI
jgi:hypothetical protein